MKRAARVATTLGLFVVIVCSAMAEELRTFQGRVVNINGTMMAFVPDVGGNAFDVDLTKVDQTSYAFLKSGDAVTVVGVVTPDGNRVIAVSITRNR